MTKNLSDLTDLETLIVARVGITDEELVHLEILSRLQTLGLGYTQITDASFRDLVSKNQSMPSGSLFHEVTHGTVD